MFSIVQRRLDLSCLTPHQKVTNFADLIEYDGGENTKKRKGGGQGRVICIHPSWNPKSATKQKSSEIKENTSIYKDYCIR